MRPPLNKMRRMETKQQEMKRFLVMKLRLQIKLAIRQHPIIKQLIRLEMRPLLPIKLIMPPLIRLRRVIKLLLIILFQIIKLLISRSLRIKRLQVIIHIKITSH